MTRTLLTLCLALTACVSASAHHILGVPHYAYDENYPQLPFVEVMARSGDWDLRLTYYPGIIQPGERIRFKLYGRHVETKEPLRVPLTGLVQKVAWGQGAAALGEPFAIRVGKGPEGNDYKFFLEFPDYEAYQVLVRFEFPDGGTEEIPFPVTVGVSDDTPLLLGALLVLVGAIITARVLKSRPRAARETMAV